ncbi:MAG: YdcF family protein [Kiritimatiellae bacterium]|nr:YdcF family protein [Kiritimatiellia bacterium]
MYYLKHFVNVMFNPLTIGVVLMAAGCGVAMLRANRRLWRWLGVSCFGLGVVWTWIWSTTIFMCVVGTPLEGQWPAQKVEDAPTADAIVILGGGMGAQHDGHPYPEMWTSADRVWHAARLFKAGKAPLVITSGATDRRSTVPLLKDLGVPVTAIRCEEQSRNTEENAAFVQQMLLAANTSTNRPRVLLVTSAWHMTRAKMMFERYAPQVDFVPAAADYEATVLTGAARKYDDFLPAADALMRNTSYFKEWLGQFGYWMLRR